ncbi:hypothetical protein Hanom_Chr10g00909081 [Helianthus anomalus]
MTGGRKRIYPKFSIEPGGRKRIHPKKFYRTGGSKTYIPKNFYTKTIYITLLSEKFGGAYIFRLAARINTCKYCFKYDTHKTLM